MIAQVDKHAIRLSAIALVVFSLLAGGAKANLTIEVTEGVDNPTKIAIVPFRNEGKTATEDMAAVVAADLQRSGQFQPLARGSMYSSPSQASARQSR